VTTAKLHADTFSILKTTKHPDEAFAALTAFVNSPELLAVYGALPADPALQQPFIDTINKQFPGIKLNWDVPKAMLPLIIPLEILGQFMRLISLSVRLYANMLAGHMLILVFIGLIFLTNWIVFPLSVVMSSAFYLFEVVIVVSIQAYIFAALSAIYIGSAIEPEH